MTQAALSPAVSPVGIIVSGAAGRMGKRIIAIANESTNAFRLLAALDVPQCPALGQDAGKIAGVGDLGVLVTDQWPAELRGGAGSRPVLIDFSAPAGTRKLLPEAISRGLGMLIGTTGLTPQDQAQIDEAARTIPVLQATNTSLGVNVLLKLVADAARQLGSDYDIEIIEAHHNLKKDAPSGTALSLAESICKATGRSMETDLVHGREGKESLRRKGTIGMHAVRMGDVIGEHTVYFGAVGERVEIRHVASNRDTFVRGALRAAAWLSAQKPGRYTMANVLGL